MQYMLLCPVLAPTMYTAIIVSSHALQVTIVCSRRVTIFYYYEWNATRIFDENNKRKFDACCSQSSVTTTDTSMRLASSAFK